MSQDWMFRTNNGKIFKTKGKTYLEWRRRKKCLSSTMELAIKSCVDFAKEAQQLKSLTIMVEKG